MDSAFDDDYELPDFDDSEYRTNDAQTIDDEDMILQRKTPDSLVEEPPEGYKLNKLRRDARARPPPDTTDIANTAQTNTTDATTTTPPTQITITPNVGNPIPLASYVEKNLTMQIDGNLDEPVWGELPGV